jgi:hemerythrin-like domain-containing protein
MPNIMMLLQVDHGNMAKLLDVIQQQVMNMTRGFPVNYSLLESTFTYLLGYPDQCHHPKEELVYRKLLSRCPDMAESLNDLVEEHEKLGTLTGNLSRAIRESLQDPRAANEGLASQLGEFLDLYRNHMITEEQQFFPAALQLLSRDNFAEIDFTLFDQADPLFNRETDARFVELREEITRSGVTEKANTDNRTETAWLATLQDVAAFNEAMEQSGKSIRLSHSSEGGYDLEHEGNTIVHIPECDEHRAAWCAYFFWKGHGL